MKVSPKFAEPCSRNSEAKEGGRKKEAQAWSKEATLAEKILKVFRVTKTYSHFATPNDHHAADKKLEVTIAQSMAGRAAASQAQTQSSRKS